MSELLNRPTLVLNRSWQPVHVTSVARALTMLWADTARVVDERYQLYDWEQWCQNAAPVDGEVIRAGRRRLRLPEVVVLALYDALPRLTVSFSRRSLLQRDRYQCQYCGDSPGARELTVDHITPRSRGGESTWENCVLACQSCNRRKGDLTPQQAGMELRARPVRPHWRPDFNVRRALRSWQAYV